LTGGSEKTQEDFSEDSRSPGRDLNPGPPEYEAGVPNTRPRRSVGIYGDGKILLKILGKWCLELWIGFMWLRIGKVADSCEHGNEPSGSIKGVQFLD
jgi:hypothetical protein